MNELNTEIIVTVVGIAVVALVGGLLWLFALLGGYIKTRRATAAAGSTESQLWTIAQDAYAWAEEKGKELAGSEKMDVAYRFAAELLQDAGLTVTPERIKSSIQRAWVLLEGMHKRSGQTTVSDPTINVRSDVANTVAKEVSTAIDDAVKAAYRRGGIDL